MLRDQIKSIANLAYGIFYTWKVLSPIKASVESKWTPSSNTSPI